jgi:hypothetical protein
MGVYAGPEIVENGLVLALDAGNRKSYSGSGTTWTDLSGNGNNGTLTNGPTYSSSNGGSVVFDGTNDYVITTRPSSITTGGNISICMYAKWTTKSGNTISDIQILLDNNHTGTQGFVIQDRPDLSGKPLTASGNLSSTFTVGDGNWHFIAITISGTTEARMYIDGSLNHSTSNTGSGIRTVQPNISIGYWQNGGRYLNGNVAQVSIYNRALTAAEVQQNFNALRGRFGI